MKNILVTGCERSGTTIVARQIADYQDLPYIHEGWPDGEEQFVLKHSLNLDQNIKHLEFLDYKFPNAIWFYVYRDPVEVVKSISQKIWKRVPHTVSLDDAIKQWNHVTRSCMPYAIERGTIIEYGKAKRYKFLDYRPRFTAHERLGHDQLQYIKENVYRPSWD